MGNSELINLKIQTRASRCLSSVRCDMIGKHCAVKCSFGKFFLFELAATLCFAMSVWITVLVQTTWAQYFIADEYNHRVQFCQIPGFPCRQQLLATGSAGSGASELWRPYDIAVSANGDFADRGRARTTAFNSAFLSSPGSECVTVAGGVRGEGHHGTGISERSIAIPCERGLTSLPTR